MSTKHVIIIGDSRRMPEVKNRSIHLVVTSPPYWNLKRYPDNPAQLGNIGSYEMFLDELDKVWKECYRALVPGGRLCVVIGDVCHARRKHGRHRLTPLHADVIRRCVDIGFDYLAPIIWYKIANVRTEMDRPSYFLGKPYLPNAVIKNDIEYILIFRKPGDYRHPTQEQIEKSRIPKEEFFEYFKQIWTLPGESTRNHPAPFPLEIPLRLIKMFSYVGDTVLDPFLGIGTTTLAAMRLGRNSIGYEVEPSYVPMIKRRLASYYARLDGTTVEIRFRDRA